MTRPSQARARRGIKAEIAQLAARGRPGRPPKPAPAAAADVAAPAGAKTAAMAAPPSEEQGQQFGLMVRAMVAPLYLAVCEAELPEDAWKEWGVGAGRFAAYYFPTAATHPGYQFAASTVLLAAPVLFAWPAYAAKRAAARAAARKAAGEQQTTDGAGPPARDASSPAAARPQPPSPGGRHSIGGGWEHLGRAEQ